MSRISETFAKSKQEGKPGLIPFIVAGDPDIETTRELLVELALSGASVIELGVPFSDPMADGPVIQRASERSLRNSTGLRLILDLVSDVRKETDVPVVLFSYFNPLLRYGPESFAADAARAGVDAVLVTDLAPEEAHQFATTLRRKGIDLIYLVAPTSTDDRLRLIAERASGFIYAVSRTGVTGTRDQLSSEAKLLVSRVRRFSELPVAVGFGVSNSRQVAEAMKYADAVVVGSAIVAEIERQTGEAELVKNVGAFVRSLITDVDMTNRYQSRER